MKHLGWRTTHRKKKYIYIYILFIPLGTKLKDITFAVDEYLD